MVLAERSALPSENEQREECTSPALNANAGVQTGSRRAKVAVVAADAVAITLAMVVAAGIAQLLDAGSGVVGMALVSVPIWLCVFARYRLYSTAAVSSLTSEIRRIIHAIAAAAACTALIGVLAQRDVPREWLIATIGVSLVFVLAERYAVRRVFRALRVRRKVVRRVLIVGINSEALGLAQMLEDNPVLGYEVVGLVAGDRQMHAVTALPVLGSHEHVLDLVDEYQASGVIVATSAVGTVVANRLARDLIEHGAHVELTSGLIDISADRLMTRPLGRRPVVYVEPVRRVGWRAYAKRAFDLLVAGSLLVLAAPILALSMLLIRLDSRGSVFFSQERVGKDGKRFQVRKLRTMVVDAEDRLDDLREQNEADGPLFKMKDDPRVTRVGRVLRKLSIDELPQLWNVIHGEMSIVGPRPALPDEAETWSPELHNRLRVKPGITGMWQVSGRSSSSFDDYARYDLYYVDNWSLLTDVAIVVKTIPVVLFGKGAY